MGSASQTVNVSADTIPELKTDRADVATEFTTTELENMPIPDRNFANLQLLLPGAQSLSWNQRRTENPQASKQIQVDGQAFGGVAYQLDGTDNQDPILGIIVINPPLDADFGNEDHHAELRRGIRQGVFRRLSPRRLSPGRTISTGVRLTIARAPLTSDEIRIRSFREPFFRQG